MRGAKKEVMNSLKCFFREHYRELIYQTTITIVLFVFFSHNMEGTEKVSFEAIFAPYKFAFYSNYLIGAVIINYLLMPFLYYKKRPVLFIVSVLIVLVLIIFVDEFFLEQVYFPDTRGTHFPGIAFTIIETLPIILIFGVFKFGWDFHRKQRELDELKSLVQESEIQFLKSQVNPHFLFNNLNNLYAKALKNSPKTPSIILELASVLRFMLYDSKANYIPLSRELDHLKSYTSLFILQIENRGEVQFNVQMECDRFVISPLLLVVFIENAFKHSAGSQSADIQIGIDLHINSRGVLEFKCENNYSTEYRADQTASGIGLENVRKRLKLLYPNEHQLEISNSEGRFEVALKLLLKPLEA